MTESVAISNLRRSSSYLAIDDGENIIGAMDAAGRYYGFGPHFSAAYPAARHLLFAVDILVIFSGDHRDVEEIAAKMGCTSQEVAHLQERAHAINQLHWGNIYGKCLIDTCEDFYPNHNPPDSPSEISDRLASSDYNYALGNYWDVYRTRLLWEAFRTGRITVNRDCLADGRYH